MKQFLNDITSGFPQRLTQPIIASFFEGLARIVPAIITYQILELVYQVFAHNTPLNIKQLWWLIAVACGWLFVQYILSLIAYNTSFIQCYMTSAEGRISLAEHLRKLPLGFFDRRNPADISNMILSDYAELEHAISHQVPQLISAIFFPIMAFISLLFIEYRLAFALFLGAPVCLLVLWLSFQLQHRLCQAHVKAKVDATSRLQEYILGIKDIRAHNLAGERFERLEKSFAKLKKESIRLEGILGSVMMCAITLIRSGLVLTVFVGTFLLMEGQLSLPILLLFLMIGSRVYDPITVVLINFTTLRYAMHSAARIKQIRETALPSQTITKKCTQEVAKNNNDTTHYISLENVCFAYNEEPVLKEVRFTIPRNKITALVGPSGSGKSTILKLLARFYEPQNGAILLEQKNICDLDCEELLKNISMVFQDVYLFQDTVAANIGLGKKNASQQEIENAAHKACCNDFIAKLPQGYQTQIGEGGCTLSGGEKQRLSIARAFLKDAPIILLDEATSSLDPENENRVQEAISNLINNKTVLIIAHRLKTIMRADKIVVLQNGTVVETGKHEKLLENQGLYAKLWNLQQSSTHWKR